MVIAGDGLNLPIKDNAEIVIMPVTFGSQSKFPKLAFPSYYVMHIYVKAKEADPFSENEISYVETTSF